MATRSIAHRAGKEASARGMEGARRKRYIGGAFNAAKKEKKRGRNPGRSALRAADKRRRRKG
jgi:hypothetical protein